MGKLILTVGIPVYNGERFIEKAIKSVLNQTFKDFELIITDDGSTDKTVEIIKSFNDPRIKLVADGENHGISYRLNQQIDMARGEYFARMDADDIMFPERLEQELKFLQQNKSIDIVGTKVIVIDDDDDVIGERQFGNNYSDISKLFEITRFVHPTVMAKTEWFRKYKYRDVVKGCEDCDLWIRSFHETKSYEMESPLLFYRDPLKFKISTYLFRKKQGRKMRKTNRFLLANDFLYYRSVVKSYLVSFISVLVHFLSLDRIVISRRNSNMNNTEFNNILKNSIQ